MTKPFSYEEAAAPQSTSFSYEDAIAKPEKPRTRGVLETANDTVIEVANAAAGGVSSLANFVRPGNAVSSFIDKNIIKDGESKQSDVVKTAKQTLSEGIQNADGIGGELAAVGKYAINNPLLAAGQAAGSFAVPGAAAKVLGRVGGIGAGAAMAGGDAAGTAYDLSSKAGATDAQALAAGRQASVIPALVGGVTGAFGAEKLLAGGAGFKGGIVNRALKTGLSEAGQEGFEEGVTQYEGQRAAMPYDATIDPSKGVAAAAGMGAIMGGATGAGVSLLTGNRDVAKAPQTPPPVEPVLPTPTIQPVIQQTQSEQMGIDRTAGPVSKVAADAVDTGVHAQTVAASITGNTPAQMFADQGQNPLQSALQANNSAPDLIANDAINTTAIAENAPEIQAETPAFGSAYAQRQATAPKIEPTDILNTDGKPFLTGFTAKKAATDAGEGFRPFKIAEKQYVVRQFAPENATNKIAEQAIETQATSKIEAKNAPKAEAIEAGTPAGIAGTQPAAADAAPRTGVLEAPRVSPTTTVQTVPPNKETLIREIESGVSDISGVKLSGIAIQQRKYKLKQLNEKEARGTQTAQTIETKTQGQAPTPPKSINVVPYENKPTAIDGASTRPATGSGSTVPAGVVLPERSGSDLPARPTAVSQDAEKAGLATQNIAAEARNTPASGAIEPKKSGLDGYLETLNKLQAGRVSSVLKKQFNTKDGVKTRAEILEGFAKDGVAAKEREYQVPITPKIRAELQAKRNAAYKNRTNAKTADDKAKYEAEHRQIGEQLASGMVPSRVKELVFPDGTVLSGKVLAEEVKYVEYLAAQTKQVPAGLAKMQAGKAKREAAKPTRQDAVKTATDAAKDVFAKGGTERDANRAATDALIDQMADTPDISISDDAPAAVMAAKAASAEPTKTPPDIRAEQMRQQKIKVERASRLKAITYNKSPFLAFLGKHGIALAEKREFSPDKNPMLSGYGPMFRRSGLPIDLLVSRAVEDGFLPPGTEDDTNLRELISRQLRGESIAALYTEDGATEAMQAEIDRRAGFDEEQLERDAEAQLQQQFDEEALELIANSAFIDENYPDPVDALLELGFTYKDIEDTYNEYNAQNSGQSEDAQTGRGASSAAASEAKSPSPTTPSPAQEEGLTAPTREGILAQQERAAQAEKDQAAADKAAEKAAKAAADKKEIDARQQASAENFQLGQSAEDSLSGQASMFDAPAEPAKPDQKPSVAGESIAKAATKTVANDRDNFTLERYNRETNEVESITFTRGEYVSHKHGKGEIDGISQAKHEFSVDGLWYPFGYAYKAEKPEAIKPETVPLSSVVDAINKKNSQGLTDADAVPNSSTILDAESSLWSRITDGKATVDEFKAGFARWVSGKDAILEALSKNKKDDLLKMGGSMFAYRNKSENKASIVESLWRDGATNYVIGRSFQYGMDKNAWLDGIRAMVENTDADQLAQYAASQKAAQEEAVAKVGKIAEAIKDPKTLDDYKTWMRATMSGGKTFKEARMILEPEQRAAFDELVATESRGSRKASKDEQRSSVSVAGQNTDGNIIATKHTKKGHDVFVVQLAERVSKEDYNTLNAGAKRIGGYYSSFRGAGATPGFQFTDRAQAEAFVKLANGDNTDAQAAAKANRNAFEDDRSQTAVERLTEMADRLEDRADASLNQQRKENTDKRARQAASAQAAANADKATAKTMRNIAGSVADGSAKFLDRVRQKVQVEALQGYIATAQYDELRAKYPDYSAQERHRGEAPTIETVDFAEFPTFSAYRSDLAALARQLVTVDGTKLMGQKLLKVADDVSDAFNAFAKENTAKLMAFRKKDGSLAAFSSREAAERSIEGSGFKGKAVVYMVKRGEYALILSPSEAIERGVWKGDGDQRIALSPEFGAEMVEKIGKAARRGAKVSVPWQLESAHDRRKLLSRMGIETPAEFRAALREFIGLQEQAAAPDKVKQLERAMVGRRNDGLDFFPTPESVADEMVATADIQPGMSVLEPSAGWGHIAERIRAAGVDPDVGEMSNDRRELLEAKGFRVVGHDFMEMNPRDFFTFGDTFKAQDGTVGVMHGLGGLGSNRVRLEESDGSTSYHDRDDLTGTQKNGTESGYDRILMNPPFSDGRDIQHVQHAYTLLKPGGRIVAIMGESAFTNQNKRATEFREWLDQIGGTEEKLAEGSFNDPNLPVNTSANARMVVIEKSANVPAAFSRGNNATGLPLSQVKSITDTIKARWSAAPEIVIAANMDDAVIPQAVRDHNNGQLSQGAQGQPEGFFYGGKVYLIADQLATPKDVMRVLFHETLGHVGLRGAFGESLTPILKQIAVMRQPEVAAKAAQYGFDMTVESERLQAAEEVLAVMAQTKPEMGFVKRAIAAIRTWLRAHGVNLQLSDGDIIANYILPARAFIENSEGIYTKDLAFSRDANKVYKQQVGQTDSTALSVPRTDSKSSLDEFGDERPHTQYDPAKAVNVLDDAKKRQYILDAWLEHYDRADTAKYELDHYDSSVDSLINNGGKIYRQLFVNSPGEVRAAADNMHWAIDQNAIIEAHDGLKRHYSKGKSMTIVIEAIVPPRSITNTDVDLHGNPEEKEVNILRDAPGVTYKAFEFKNGNISKLEMTYVSNALNGKKSERQTSTPSFKAWFGDSKVVDASGNPQVMYHGTGRSFDAFDNQASPASEGSKRGAIFLTSSPKWASEYAKDIGGGNVMPLYVKAENPFDFENSQHIDLLEKYEKKNRYTERAITSYLGVKTGNWEYIEDRNVQAFIKSEGFDGFYVMEHGNKGLGVYSSTQIKSATGNNGNFDASNPDIRFSRSIGDTLKAVTVTDIKAKAGNKLADYRNLGLQFLGGRQLADLYGDDIPQIDSYTKMVQQMSADANEVGAQADAIVTSWAKLTDERQLAELMHDATLMQIDPAKDYVDGDNRMQWGKLNTQFKALTPEAKMIFTDARDSYEEHYSRVREAIQEKIERSAMGKESKARMLERMDGEFFDKIKGVYFPLARFGKYVVVTRDGAGNVVNVSRAETLNEAEALRKDMQTAYPRNSGYAVGKVLKDKEFNASRDAVGRGFLKELFGVLDQQGVGDQLQDAVNQLYLASMPDLSWAKHGIHRKGTPGFSQDARRAYAQNMFHGARYLAKLRFADQLQDKLTAMEDFIESKNGDETFDQPRARDVVNEYVARHDTLMNPKSSPLSTALTSFGFVFHMGLSPASAMVNLSGTALVAYPMMGAKWGFNKAAGALLVASKQAASNKNDISKALSKDEKLAYDAAVKAGTIDVTAAHDLAGIAQGEDAGVMWKIRPVMKWASFMFHHAERFNRQVTFVASYRLARGAGANHENAFEQATKATYDTHFDYSASNRPRIMQGNIARVALLFKQYGQNMVYTLTRQAQLAMNAETPQGRAEARKALGGLLVMHASAAGVLGLPLVGPLLAMASMLGGSDDEPWDAEIALRNMLADTFGQKPAEVMAKGFSRLTPWDISGRVGLNHLILPDIQEGLEGQRLGESAMAAALGPVAGIGINILKGMQEISEGHVARGYETMMPVALRSPMKALRYEMEGAKDKTGVMIQDEVSAAGVAGQALGFSPSDVRNATEGRSAIFKADGMLMQRRKELMSQYARAATEKDAEAMAEAREAIKKFNETNPNRRISNMNMLQSVKNKAKRVEEAQNGVFLPKKRREVLEEGRFAE